MRKLYAATVTVYVVAENDIEAQFAATHAEIDYNEWEVEGADTVSEEWEKLIPWGLSDDDPDWTCSQILDGEAEL